MFITPGVFSSAVSNTVAAFQRVARCGSLNVTDESNCGRPGVTALLLAQRYRVTQYPCSQDVAVEVFELCTLGIQNEGLCARVSLFVPRIRIIRKLFWCHLVRNFWGSGRSVLVVEPKRAAPCNFIIVV